MTLNDVDNVASTGPYACHVCHCTPPPPMYMYGLRAAQTPSFRSSFFVTKYRNLFCDQGAGRGGGGGSGPDPPPKFDPTLLPSIKKIPLLSNSKGGGGRLAWSHDVWLFVRGNTNWPLAMSHRPGESGAVVVPVEPHDLSC